MHALMRSLLFLPGNREKFLEKAASFDADGFIIDFEDSVPARGEGGRAQMPHDLRAGAARKVHLGSPERVGLAILSGRP